MASETVADLNEKAVALKETWGYPIPDQLQIRETLQQFRDSLNAGQEKVDSIDFPEECVELATCLGRVVDRGRDLANLVEPYSDYIDRIAPIISGSQSIVDELNALTDAGTVSSGIASLALKADSLETSFLAIEPYAPLLPMHKRLHTFLLNMKSLLRSTSSSPTRSYTDPVPDPAVVEEEAPEDDETDPDAGDNGGRSVDEGIFAEPKPALNVIGRREPEATAPPATFSALPSRWQAACEEMLSMFNDGLENAGVREQYVLLEEAIVEIVEELARLEGKRR